VVDKDLSYMLLGLFNYFSWELGRTNQGKHPLRETIRSR
jgi:hypothetical protein